MWLLGLITIKFKNKPKPRVCEDLLFGKSHSSRVDFQNGKIKKCWAPLTSSYGTSPQTEGPLSSELNICSAVSVYLVSAGL